MIANDPNSIEKRKTFLLLINTFADHLQKDNERFIRSYFFEQTLAAIKKYNYPTHTNRAKNREEWLEIILPYPDKPYEKRRILTDAEYPDQKEVGESNQRWSP